MTTTPIQRIVATLGAAALAVTMSALAPTAQPQAAAATRYLQPVTTITPAKGCAVLRPGYNGTKVKVVQRALGMPNSSWETMDATTIARVKAFQKRKGMKQTGVVDLATWRALGTGQDFCMDGYQVPVALPLSASKAQRVDTMVKHAVSYVGGEYVWGGAGTRAQGVDCSGLVLQSLYRAGLDPQPVTVDKHVLPDYRTSKAMYEHPGLKRVPRSQVRRGDLVFYRSNRTGQVNHVAIFIGNGQVVEARGSSVAVRPYARTLTGQTVMPDVVRPFEEVLSRSATGPGAPARAPGR